VKASREVAGVHERRYRDFYTAVNEIVQRESLKRVVFNVNARGAGWYRGEYWAMVRPASPEPAFVRLDRLGRRPNSVPYSESPDLAETIARLVIKHLGGQSLEDDRLPYARAIDEKLKPSASNGTPDDRSASSSRGG
jgi:hypothetical protein